MQKVGFGCCAPTFSGAAYQHIGLSAPQPRATSFRGLNVRGSVFFSDEAAVCERLERQDFDFHRPC